MTHLARLYEEERLDHGIRTRRETLEMVVRNMLSVGLDNIQIIRCSGLTREEIRQIQTGITKENQVPPS